MVITDFAYGQMLAQTWEWDPDRGLAFHENIDKYEFSDDIPKE